MPAMASSDTISKGELINVATKGQSLELFFIDGRPDGMLTAEVFN